MTLLTNRINEFTCTMTKLKALISNSPDESSKRLTNLRKFLKKVTLTENGEYKHQDATLQNYQASLNALSSNYIEFISKINEGVEGKTLKICLGNSLNNEILRLFPL